MGEVWINEAELRNLMELRLHTVVDTYNKEFERLAKECAGQPVATIKPLILSVFRDNGGSISEQESYRLAEFVREGAVIEYKI